MALKQAQIKPTLQEKRRLTLEFLEASVMQGNEVNITPVAKHDINELNKETYTYMPTVTTYITFDTRPSVKLLRQYGWFKEDQEIVPIVAYIPTHLLYEKTEGDIDYQQHTPNPKDVANFIKLGGNEYKDLVHTGESINYVMKPLRVVRGTIIDIVYDFMPDNSNKFYVTDVKVDTDSINYVANLMPYKYDKALEGEETYNTPQLSIDTREVKF